MALIRELVNNAECDVPVPGINGIVNFSFFFGFFIFFGAQIWPKSWDLELWEGSFGPLKFKKRRNFFAPVGAKHFPETRDIIAVALTCGETRPQQSSCLKCLFDELGIQASVWDKYLMGHKIMVLGIICRCTGRVNSRLIFRTKKFIVAGFVSLRVYPVWQIVTNTPRYLVSCGFVFILSKAHTLDDLWWHPDKFTCSHCSHCSLQVCVLYIVFTSELQCIIIKHHYHKQFQFCILYLPECLN